MMPHLQFRLRSLFILTAIVAVGCLVGPPAWRVLPPSGRDAIWQTVGAAIWIILSAVVGIWITRRG
jgi:hypothetical protein